VSVVAATAPNDDSPLHVHRAEDELVHGLEGELRLHIGGPDLRLGAGETALAPQRVPHSYRVEAVDGASWLVVTTKGDFERVVRTVGRPAELAGLPEPSGSPTQEQVDALAAVCSACNIDLVGPSLL
jgi:cupin domain